MTEEGKSREPIVLDAEGSVLHDPNPEPKNHRRPHFKVIQIGQIGWPAKILLGGAFAILLVFGLTIAGVALGVLLVSFLFRSIFIRTRR